MCTEKVSVLLLRSVKFFIRLHQLYVTDVLWHCVFANFEKKVCHDFFTFD